MIHRQKFSSLSTRQTEEKMYARPNVMPLKYQLAILFLDYPVDRRAEQSESIKMKNSFSIPFTDFYTFVLSFLFSFIFIIIVGLFIILQWGIKTRDL